MGKNFRSPSQATTSSVIASYTDLTKRERFREKTRRNFYSCGRFMYNKEKNTVCNKTWKNWVSLIGFYLIFLTVLLGVFFGVIVLVMYFIKSSRTEAFYDKTTLVPGSSPAIGILPRLRDRVAAVIWYTHTEPINKKRLSPEPYVRAIDKLLEPYDKQDPSLYVNCDIYEPKKEQYCSFTREMLGPCGKQGYGYDDDKPCVYLKLNRLKGWVPKRGNVTGGQKNSMRHMAMGLTCSGITHFDKDHVGMISFYPSSGFKEYFFPYDGSPNYRAPLVAIQFENLDRGFVIGVRCLFDREITNMQNEALHTATVFLYIDNK